MMVPTASNVVKLPKVGNAHVAKGSVAKSSSNAPERGSFEAQVAVLFPRTKMTANVWAKAQKAAAETGAGSEDQDDVKDQANGQNVFGSLVASVEQKLLNQDDQAVQETDPGAADEILAASSLPAAQLMRREKLTDGLQVYQDKPKADTSVSNSFSNVVATPLPADETDQPKPLFAVKPPNATTQMPQIADDFGEPQPIVVAAAGTISSSAPTSKKPVESSSNEMLQLTGLKEQDLQRTNPEQVSNLNTVAVAFPNGNEGGLLTPAAQIVENIRNAIPPASVATQANDAVPLLAKTLEIQLRPEGLGMVTVSLKSELGKLKVQISAELESTRHNLERDSTELVSGLQRVDPTFKGADINFSNQNQETSQDTRGQMSGSGGERRGTPENMSGFGSNGGQDANQANGNIPNPAFGKSRTGQKLAVGELPSRGVRADGIYL